MSAAAASTVVELNTLLDRKRLWRGPAPKPDTPSAAPTGHVELDAALPSGGWPESAISELMLAADGIGEIQLLLPTLVRLTQQGRAVVWVAPPYRPYAPALARAGVDLAQLHVIDADDQAPWALEQCLRSQACAAVLGWLPRADDRCLRRLQVAAETGHALGFLFRPEAAAQNPSPAALRLALQPGLLRVLKCRGGVAPERAFALNTADLNTAALPTAQLAG
ncbi:MAG: translesion DNA synthesis-associated protein ImuA [Xanthomonadales bacterium]|nr:translesion DNA synthesis-associated protein ImuA [Xanthomonadales bacterium]